MRTLPLLALGMAALHGCAGFHPAPPPEHTTFLVDSTASVVPSSFAEAINAIEAHVNRMQRGDCITVMPIISDSDAIPSDEIVRGCAPEARQPYDQDLKAFRDRLHGAIEAQSQKLSAKKASKTDILGTIELVDQELALDAPNIREQIVIFSDFIEEDDSRNFIRMRELANEQQASQLARLLAREQEPQTMGDSRLSKARVLLGGLQSSELPHLPEERRRALRQFWATYFALLGSEPTYMKDGPGTSGRFLSERK